MNKSFHSKLLAVVITLLLLLAAVTGGYAYYLQCHAIFPPLWMCLTSTIAICMVFILVVYCMADEPEEATQHTVAFKVTIVIGNLILLGLMVTTKIILRGQL